MAGHDHTKRRFVAGLSGMLGLAAAGPGAAAPPTRTGPPLAPLETRATRHPLLSKALETLSANDWRAMTALVAPLAPQSAYMLLADLGDVAPTGVDFSAAAGLPLGDTIAGALHVGWAWRHRGVGFADTVTPAGLQGFQRELTLAKTNLLRAVATDKDDGIAQTFLVTVAKGLEERLSLTERIDAALYARRRPVACFSMIASALSEKWTGVKGADLAFARRAMALDLPASAGVLPRTHLEIWALRSIQTPVSLATYLQSPAVFDDIISADNAFNSVALDPDPFANWYARSQLAYALVYLDELQRARPHMEALGAYIGDPWSRADDPEAAIGAVRRALGLEHL